MTKFNFFAFAGALAASLNTFAFALATSPVAILSA